MKSKCNLIQLEGFIVSQNTTGKITVNSYPYAVSVYHRLGFKDTDKEQVTNGLRYTPMEMYVT